MSRRSISIILPDLATARLAKPDATAKIAGFERHISLRQAADILGCSIATVRRRVTEKKLIPVQDHKGARISFTPDHLRRYVASVTGGTNPWPHKA